MRNDELNDLKITMRWIIERIEEEGDHALEGNRANWKRAAFECVEEAYEVLARIEATQKAPTDK